MENADLICPRKPILEMQTENEDLPSCSSRHEKLQMDTLLKFCFEENRSTGLESDVKRLTMLLGEGRSERCKLLPISRLRSTPWLQSWFPEVVLELIQVVEMMTNVHGQTLKVHGAEVSKLKRLVDSSQKKAKYVEYESSGVKACLQNLCIEKQKL